jgi:hypothetical protein
MVFLAQFSFKKLGWHLPFFFFLSSSNKNRGKAFVVLSEKKKKCTDTELLTVYFSGGAW